MNSTLSRRTFLTGSMAAFLTSGCGTFRPFESPRLRFGVVSDIHVTTPESAALFEKALRIFKSNGADAVMVPGDLTDWGLRSSLAYVRAAWDRVFAGTSVVPLFCTGNHDYDGWAYGDMTMEMHANGYSEDDAMSKNGLDAKAGVARSWEEAFGTRLDDIRLRTVKGYDFISYEYRAAPYDLEKFLVTHENRFAGRRPFFFFQHRPVKGTTSDSANGLDFASLARFPNCVSFSGHTHMPFGDERLIWQDAFTQISVPSLSYSCFSHAYENGEPRGKTGDYAMPPLPTRRELRGGQGYFVSVYEDRIELERLDLEEDGATAAPAWIVPLGTTERPYDRETRARASVAPVFPAGAKLHLETRNTENRSGQWIIVLDCRFPTARLSDGLRPLDYEIRAVPQDGSAPLVKRFISPGYAYLPKYEPDEQRFWFNVAELPQDVDYVVEVYARNSFGKRSAPLVSDVRHMTPGLGKAKR